MDSEQTTQQTTSETRPETVATTRVGSPAAPVAQPRLSPLRSTVRLVLTLIMNLLIVFGLLLLIRLFLVFFLPLHSVAIYKPLVSLTNPLVLPLQFSNIPTSFRGSFEVNTTISLLAILVVEYLMSVVRRNT